MTINNNAQIACPSFTPIPEKPVTNMAGTGPQGLSELVSGKTSGFKLIIPKFKEHGLEIKKLPSKVLFYTLKLLFLALQNRLSYKLMISIFKVRY